MLRLAPVLLAAGSLTACATQSASIATSTAPPGSTQVFHEALGAAPGAELIVTDLTLAADARGPAHYHPWEEYLYVLEGSVMLYIEGTEQRTLSGPQGFVIPARAVHTPHAGPAGVRAIVVRVHRQGDPVRVLADAD